MAWNPKGRYLQGNEGAARYNFRDPRKRILIEVVPHSTQINLFELCSGIGVENLGRRDTVVRAVANNA